MSKSDSIKMMTDAYRQGAEAVVRDFNSVLDEVENMGITQVNVNNVRDGLDLILTEVQSKIDKAELEVLRRMV